MPPFLQRSRLLRVPLPALAWLLLWPVTAGLAAERAPGGGVGRGRLPTKGGGSTVRAAKPPASGKTAAGGKVAPGKSPAGPASRGAAPASATKAAPVAAVPPVAGPVGAQMLSSWRGEYFDKKQGGLYVKISLRGFPSTKQTKFITGGVQVLLYNILDKKPYLFSHRLADIDKPPAELWKLPGGKYDVQAIVMVDAAGVRREWREGGVQRKGQPAAKRTSIIVRRLSLSNLGLWTLSPAGANGLDVKFQAAPNTYKELNKKESSVKIVINGFTGLEQEVFGGRKLAKDAAGAGDFGTEGELRATVKFTRQIAMFYKLDLFKYNHYAPAIASVLGVSDTNLRTCFTNRLEWNDALKGDVKFTFLLSKESGTMSKLKHTGGTLDDPKLVECMYWELAQIQFPVQENMIGELTYTYDVR